MLKEEYDKLKNMQNAEEDTARIFGLGEETVRDTILPQVRDSIANGLNGTLIEPNMDFNENELNMPSYYNPETRDNYDDLIQSSFIQEARSNSYGS